VGIEMKRKIIAFLMISIMVLTIATVAVTAKSVSAASTQTNSQKTNSFYQVKVGRPYVWPWPFYNYHDAFNQNYPHTGSATSTAVSEGAKLAVKAYVSSDPEASAYGVAKLAVRFHVDGLTQDNWPSLHDKPVTLRAVVSYKITSSGSGTSSYMIQLRGAYPGPGYLITDSHTGTPYTISETRILKYSTHLYDLTGDLFSTHPPLGNGEIWVTISDGVSSGTDGPTYSSMSMTVHALTLTWE
jgi:hypothetical protein